jgi:hypothetical protein
MIKLITYSGQTDANFFIQCKGNNSGRPLVDPIPNCFAVYTDVPYAFDIIQGLFISKKFVRDIIGSCIPFIKKQDLLNIIEPQLKKSHNLKELEAINLVDQQIENTLKKIDLLKKLKISLAQKSIKSAI